MWRMFHDDCLHAMQTMDAESVDAIVCDPPYGLGFMGKEWDHGVPGVPFWEAALRVAKPGAHLLAFGGTRTHHRLTCAIEDAGWEIRDGILWLYGSGFPKSVNVSKMIDARRDDTPSLEPVRAFLRVKRDAAGLTNAKIAAAFGFSATMASHWIDHPTQPTCPTLEQWDVLRMLLGFGDEMDDRVRWLNARKGTPGEAFADREVVSVKAYSETSLFGGANGTHVDSRGATELARQWEGWGSALKPGWEPIIVARKPLRGTIAQNVERYGTGALNIDACRIAAPDGVTQFSYAGSGQDTTYGRRHDTVAQTGERSTAGRWPANVVLDEDAAAELDAQSGERGGAAPASGPSLRGETNGTVAYGARKGMDGAPSFHGDSGGASRFYYTAKASGSERHAGVRANDDRANTHPTVKPLDLMRWLCKLVAPIGATILDPFAGSGSTGCAAMLEGMAFVGVEREAEYYAIACDRIRHHEELYQPGLGL